MKILLVYDNPFDPVSLEKALKNHGGSEVVVFPLTGDSVFQAAISRVISNCKCEEKVYNSARKISECVILLRNNINKWSADIGNFTVFSKNVKDWLLLPGYGVSAWWFGLLSEKNTLKTDAYFQIAQIHALEGVLNEKFDFCVFSIADPRLHDSLLSLLCDRHVRFKAVPAGVASFRRGIKNRMRGFLKKLGWFGSISHGFVFWCSCVVRGYRARKNLPARVARERASNAVLVVSYFPAAEAEPAKNGVFINKYWAPLQEKLKELKRPVIWLLMTVQIYGYDFPKTLVLAGKFARHGENLYVIDEFLTLRLALRGLCLWLRQAFLGAYLLKRVENSVLLAEPVGKHCRSIVTALWNRSFCGPVAMEGILYTLIFEEALKQLPDVADCICYGEMQSWDKALNTAKRRVKPRMRTIGYQHSSVAKNNMSYFFDRSEMTRSGKDSDLPLPDILACNGKYSRDLLAESGYPEVVETEAIRYLYLEKILSRVAVPRSGRPILLVAGTYDKNESLSLAALVYAAFPEAKQFDIWFKGHPNMFFEKIFLTLGIDYTGAGYTIKHGNLSEYVDSAWAVIVPSSTVALEALGAGCEVIVPVFPDVMLMNPLSDFDNYCHNVATPQELKSVVLKIASGFRRQNSMEQKEFIRNYWNLNPALPLWTKLLETAGK